MAVLLTALILMTSSPHQESRWATVQPYNAKLERIAMCESTKRWHIVVSGVDHGVRYAFYGGLQFELATWQSVGGKGYPHKATVLEQKYRAVKLIKRRGYQPWPRCGGA